MKRWIRRGPIDRARVVQIVHGRRASALALGALVLGVAAASAMLAPRPPVPGGGQDPLGAAVLGTPVAARETAIVPVAAGTEVPQGVRAGPQDSPFAALATPAATPTPGLLRPSSYTIAGGDTLWSIADQFGLRPETLVWANDIVNADLIVVGQELIIPPADGVLYTVQPGERLVDIVSRYGVDLLKASTANGVTNPNFVLAGERLFLPGARELSAPASAEAGQSGPDLLPAAEPPVVVARLPDPPPMTAEVQAVLDAGWEATLTDAQLFSSEFTDAGTLATIPAGAKVERISGLEGRRIEVRYPGDGETRYAMTGWMEVPALEAANPPSPNQLPRSYPENTRMDVPQILAPYQTQLDGTPWALANCGPVSISMAMAAFGVEVSSAQLRVEVQDTQRIWGHYVGSLITALARVVRDHGLQPVGLYDGEDIHRWTLDELREQLILKRPIVVQVYYRSLPGREYVAYYGDHYIVLTGVVDDAFLYNDPVNHDGLGWDRIISGERLEEAMANANDRYRHSAFAVTDAPVEETPPEDEAPADEASADEAPADETSADQTPADEESAEEGSE